MRKKSLLITLLIIIVVLAVIYYYLINKSEFTKGSHSWAAEKMVEESEAIYLGYNMHFEGFGNPTLQNVYLLQAENNITQNNNEQISITVFIDKNNRVGALDEKYVIDEGIIDELIPVSGFKLRGSEFNLAIRVELIEKNYKKDFDTLVIEYSHFGITKKQNIKFEGIFKLGENINSFIGTLAKLLIN